MNIGIIGGSIAGSYAAHLLAGQGRKVTVFERRPDREKPCGGGVTAKALELCPEIGNLDVPYRTINSMRVISSFGTEAIAQVDQPFRIFSRNVFDSALRRLASESGATIVHRNVGAIDQKNEKWILDKKEEFDFLIGAGGFADPLARFMGRSFDRADTTAMVGYFVPGDFKDCVDIRLLGQMPGYIWVFPRVDHASVGIMVGAKNMHRAGAYKVLDRFIARYYPDVDMNQANRYGAPAPMIMNHAKITKPVCGANWALVGDAAGFCDPLTGEGIFYALSSARFLAEAIANRNMQEYTSAVKGRIVPELQKAANLKSKFFRPWFWEAAMFLLKRSPTCQATAADFIAGSQDYQSLRPRTFKEMPKMLTEALLNIRSLWYNTIM